MINSCKDVVPLRYCSIKVSFLLSHSTMNTDFACKRKQYRQDINQACTHPVLWHFEMLT